jgi:hypothetical protein
MGGGGQFYIWAEIEAKPVPLKALLLLLAPPTRFSYLPAALTETIPRLSNRAVRTIGEILLPNRRKKTFFHFIKYLLLFGLPQPDFQASDGPA